MKKEGWIRLIKSLEGDEKKMGVLASLLEEHDQAKQLLADEGYSCTGLGLLESVRHLINETRRQNVR